MRISDWSSDVCSSDLGAGFAGGAAHHARAAVRISGRGDHCPAAGDRAARCADPDPGLFQRRTCLRSEEHTSELQSLMRISYAVLCLKKKKIREPYHCMQQGLNSKSKTDRTDKKM